MAGHSYEELKHQTVAQLREIAAGIEHDAVKGYTQLNKELKKQREEALAAHNHKRLKAVRREIHWLKVKLHRAAV
jgi:hypothetical protein